MDYNISEIDAQVTALVVEAVPEIMKTVGGVNSEGESNFVKLQTRPIQLADVIRAINKTPLPFCMDSFGEMIIGDTSIYWNLSLDYAHQTEETKRAIYSLLKT